MGLAVVFAALALAAPAPNAIQVENANAGTQPGTYRFAAVAVDEWGQSVPALSHPVVVRKSRR